MEFSAVLLAGGASSRMGRDKAGIVVDGVPLWRRQLGVLREAGACEVFIAGPDDGRFSRAGCEVLPDAVAGCGPLAGIAGALRRMRAEWLFVLAVDMPRVTGGFVRDLAYEAARAGRGIVPFHCDAPARIEPLAAVYPCAAADFAQRQIACGDLKLAHFIEALERAGLMSRSAAEPTHFENWNHPDDVRPM